MRLVSRLILIRRALGILPRVWNRSRMSGRRISPHFWKKHGSKNWLCVKICPGQTYQMHVRQLIFLLWKGQTWKNAAGVKTGARFDLWRKKAKCTRHELVLTRNKLPEKNRDPLACLNFWNAFEATMQQQTIPTAQKVQFLWSILTGSSKHTTDGVPITLNSYSEATSLLEGRFGNTRALKQKLFTQLKTLPLRTGD